MARWCGSGGGGGDQHVVIGKVVWCGVVLDKEIIFSPACGNWQGGVVGILWQACLHPGSALWSLRFFHHIAPYPFVPVQLVLSFFGGL